MNGTREEQKTCPTFRFIGSHHQFSPWKRTVDRITSHKVFQTCLSPLQFVRKWEIYSNYRQEIKDQMRLNIIHWAWFDFLLGIAGYGVFFSGHWIQATADVKKISWNNSNRDCISTISCWNDERIL
jgi:hypothetical protein